MTGGYELLRREKTTTGKTERWWGKDIEKHKRPGIRRCHQEPCDSNQSLSKE